MPVRSVGTYVSEPVSREELTARLDRLLQCVERLHPGSVQSYIAGPSPVREVWFTYTLRVTYQLEYTVERGGIRVRFPIWDPDWLTFLERQRRDALVEDHAEFYAGSLGDGLYETAIECDRGTKRFLVTYEGVGDGEDAKTVNLVTPSAEGHACFLDTLLGTRFEEALAAPDDPPADLFGP